jgi:L-threonylcarbamoyladenylate synthase
MATSDSQHEQIASAAGVLKAGGVVAFPTETVYGLGADAMNASAVRRVFEIKGRPSRNPLIVHVSSVQMATRCVAPGAFDARATRLAQAFWPGPLTLVLPKAPGVPDVVTGGGPTVAIRVPSHPIALALIDALGGPIVGPSANVSGHVSPTTAAHVRAEFGDAVMVLDGGACVAGIESTVLWLGTGQSDRAIVLRQGVISAGQIEAALGEPVGAATISDEDSRAVLASPGLLTRHYSPRTRAERVEWGDWACVRAIIDREQGKIGVLCFSTPPDDIERAATVEHVGEDPMIAAAKLYAAMRRLDDANPSVIAIEMPPERWAGSAGMLHDQGVWEAIRDRLSRATSSL